MEFLSAWVWHSFCYFAFFLSNCTRLGFRFDFLCVLFWEVADHCLREVGKSRVGLLEAVVFEGNFGHAQDKTLK